MAVPTLPRLREVPGEEGVDKSVRWLDSQIAERAVPRDEYREVLPRLDILEHDVSDIKVEVRDLRREMNGRFDQMYDRMPVQTRWLIGSLAFIGTVVSVLLTIGQFAP